MAQEIKANLGTKLTEEEEKTVDKSNAGMLSAQPRDMVAPQWYSAVQVCPYCGCIGYGIESDTRYLLFTCHCCGRTFRA
jgi:Rieske Fe-S protein